MTRNEFFKIAIDEKLYARKVGKPKKKFRAAVDIQNQIGNHWMVYSETTKDGKKIIKKNLTESDALILLLRELRKYKKS